MKRRLWEWLLDTHDVFLFVLAALTSILVTTYAALLVMDLVERNLP